MKRFVVLLLLMVFAVQLHAQKVFEFNSICQQAYQELTKLKPEAGKALLAKAKQMNPNNLMPVFLESYADFYQLLLNENPADYAAMYPRFAERIALLKQGPEASPFYGFCLGVVRMQKAAVSIKFGKFWDGGWEVRRAYAQIKDNRKAFPTFGPNDLIYGSLQAIMSTIPKGYKWIAGILGMKGSLTEGMKTVRSFVNSSDPWAKVFFNEGAFVYPYLLFYLENKKDEAIAFAKLKKLDLVNNHLHAYMAANLCLNNQQSDLAQKIILERNMSNEYLRTTVWDFELGFTRLHQLDLPASIRHFESFLQQFKGSFYVKDALQKLSWAYYLSGNMAKAEEARKKILVKGATNSDADKQALKDAKTGKWPNMLLLKARLLSDGGHAKEALALLHGKTEDDFASEEEKLEFAYRVGRIYDALERDDDAIRNYLIAIRMGEHRPEQFAARAALQIGYIYEKRGQKALAIVYYQRCLDMDDHEFKDSLDQRAKSGIARCKGE